MRHGGRVQQLQRGIARCDRHGIGAKGAEVEDLPIPGAILKDRHGVRPTGDRANRETTTDDLRHGGEIRFKAVVRLQSAIGQSKCDDLVADQHHAGFGGFLSYGG